MRGKNMKWKSESLSSRVSIVKSSSWKQQLPTFGSVFFVALVLLFSFAVAEGANVVADSDMEGGNTPWVDNHVDVLATNSSAKASDQSASLQSLKGTSATGSKKIPVEWYNWQNIGAVSGGPTAVLNLWYGIQFFANLGQANGTLYFDVRRDGGPWNNAWTQAITPSFTFQSGTVTNQDVSGSFATDGNYDIRVRFAGQTGNSNSAQILVWWDDVVLDLAAPNNPPNAPADHSQYKSDETTPIAQGGTTDETTVVIKATVSDPDGGTVQLQVEIIDNGSVYSSAANCSSGFVASGSVATATCAGLTDGVSYKWRARTNDGALTSGWQTFGGSDPDVTIAIPDPPNAPADHSQYKSDGTTPIAQGGTTDETTVVIKATVSDPDGGTVQLQVEIIDNGSVYSSAANCSSGFVASGLVATATCAGLTDGVSYKWRARTNDGALTSAWQTFGGSDPDVTIDLPNPPNAPVDHSQYKSDETTPIAQSGTTDETTVVIKATVSDPDGGTVQLQVEIIDDGSAYSSAANCSSGFVASGSVATATCAGLTDGVSYKWRARTNDGALTSAWQTFGGSDPDVTIAVPDPPNAPVDHSQYKSDGTTPIAQGGTTDETTVVIKATVSDPDGGTVQLQVEIIDDGSAYSSAANCSSGFVASGSVATATCAGLTDGVSYKWRARTNDGALTSGMADLWRVGPGCDHQSSVDRKRSAERCWRGR